MRYCTESWENYLLHSIDTDHKHSGGGAGFGRAICERFATEGAAVFIGDINEDAANETAQRIGGDRTHVAKWDVTSADDWKRAVEVCIKKFGRLDIVVNNAGTTYKNKPTETVTEEEFDKVFTVNVKSLFQCVNAVVPRMKEQGNGSVITVSSIGSVRPRPGLTCKQSFVKTPAISFLTSYRVQQHQGGSNKCQ